MNGNPPETGILERAARGEASSGRPLASAVTGAVFALSAALVGADLLKDMQHGSGFAHVGIELALMTCALVAAAVFWWRFAALRREARSLVSDLDAARADADRWRAEAQDALRGLGAAIDHQFDRWKLSAAEREVALLLLKGLSLKEIADLRQTSERTVRQQSLGVYRKGGLSGRAELAAFFLEDLLLPQRPGEAGARAAD